MAIDSHPRSMSEQPIGSTPERRDRFPSSVAVLIPAWEPDEHLPAIVGSLAALGCRAILVIDDGSSAASSAIFQDLRDIPGVSLVRHPRNLGKGRAIKTGLQTFLADLPEYTGVVTADADGQHTVEDIARVAAMHDQESQRLVLGVRCLNPEMPFRSRFGNELTRYVFRGVTGITLADTQTGLRGFPRALVPEILALHGDRYEYEMNVLACWCSPSRTPIQVPIETVYTDGNRSSRFRPIRDSIRIYRVLLRHGLHRWFPRRAAR
jgi:glycosyltransferase involved in cell wall biosynthesis